MRELFDDQLPESERTDDILGGVIDGTMGEATQFFDHLTEDEREITQWYLFQGIGPFQAEGYAIELARGYAVVDPNRVNADAMASAHVELDRLQTFIDIFLRSNNYFPKIDVFNMAVRNENGDYAGSIDIQGWGSMGRPTGDFSLRGMQEMVRIKIVPIIEMSKCFIDNPKGVPNLFDQDEILAQHLVAVKTLI